MYATVPTTVPALVMPGLLRDGSESGSSCSATFFASPQSITTVSPYAPTSTFDGVMSRWMMRWPCAKATASVAAITAGSSASRVASVGASAIASRSVRPATMRIA